MTCFDLPKNLFLYYLLLSQIFCQILVIHRKAAVSEMKEKITKYDIEISAIVRITGCMTELLFCFAYFKLL